MIKTKKELSDMNTKDLAELLKSALEKLAKIRIQHKLAPLKNNQLIKKYKTMVAQIKTIMTTIDSGVSDE